MTWLSRLLPQSPSQRLAGRNNRTRQAQRRRRMSTLESLEGRTLLSNIGVSQNAAGLVAITGDTHGDQFAVTVNLDNTIRVVGNTSKTNNTTINGYNNPFTWQSLYPATGLTMSLPGNGIQAADTVSLTGQVNGQGLPVTTQLKSIAVTVTGTESLTFSATGIKTTTGPGTFTLTDGTATVAGGQLSATISNSQFSALTIYQTGCCGASVDLESDIVTGKVSVTEGLANGDSITINGPADKHGNPLDSFGSTTLVQGAGPVAAPPTNLNCCLGNGDSISVNDMNLKDLTITQPTGTGTYTDYHGNTFTVPEGQGDSIAVGDKSEVEVSALSFGIVATQGDGCNDSILIESITSNGSSNSIAPGPDSIITSQGNGNCDSTIVDSSQVWGNIESTQGNGNFDCAAFTGDSAGWVDITLSTLLGQSPVVTDHFGREQIIQGNGYNDTATLDCGQIENKGAENVANYVYISQGYSLQGVDCTPGYGDVINVNCTYVYSDMTLDQGENDVNALGLGNNVVNVGTTERVFVGGNTVINELGANSANNTINLGGANAPNNASKPFQKPDFETNNLDVYTGAGGGGYVVVYNTLVHTGNQGLFGPFNINGDGDGNSIILDDYSSTSVSSAF